MNMLEKVVPLLPKLKTKLQLTGFVALIGGIIATRAVRPSAVLAQISAGAIGVLFLIFGQVFGSLGQVQPRERAQLISRLFVIFIVFVLALVLLTGFFLAHGGDGASEPSHTTSTTITRDPALDAFGASLLHAISNNNAINRLSERLSQETSARDKIKDPIRSLYSGLLQLKEQRLGFRDAIEARIALIDGKAGKQQLDDNFQVLYAAGIRVSHTLLNVESDLSRIRVDLDLQDPALTVVFHEYIIGNMPLFHPSEWRTKTSGELRELLRKLDANTVLLNTSLDDLRALLKKFYPDLGDLYTAPPPHP